MNGNTGFNEKDGGENRQRLSNDQRNHFDTNTNGLENQTITNEVNRHSYRLSHVCYSPHKPGMDNSVTLASTGSILKRVRRYDGKENESPTGNFDNKYIARDHKNNSQLNKKVRIFTPLKNTNFSQNHNLLGNPHQNTRTFIRNNLLSKKFEDDDDDDDDFQTPIVNKQKSMKDIVCKPNDEFQKTLHDDLAINKKITVGEENTKLVMKEVENDNEITVEDNVKHYVDNEEPVGNTIHNIVKNKRRNKKDFEHWLLIKYQPKILSDAIKSLTPNQKRWVRSTGFGSLLSFKMNEYPQSLSYHLALSFQSHNTSLCFDNLTIPVSDEDVNEILGLPKGKNKLVVMRNKNTEDIWREQYTSPERLGWKVTANMVCDAIKKSTVVDRLFKLNFIVLMSNILIEGPTNPYVKQTMLGFVGDIDHCNQYNWSQFLISHLKIASVAWKENPTGKQYTGSVPFLVYLYMDRVVNGKRQVRRKKPTYIGWSDILILERQILDISSNSLFQGRIALPLRYKDSDDESSYEDYTWNKNDSSLSDSEEIQCEHEKNKMISTCTSKKVSTDLVNIGTNSEKHSNHQIYDRQIQENEVPRYVIDNLKESIAGYESLQSKCIMYLSSARKLFRSNSLVNSLESKFVELVKKSNEFILNEFGNQVNIGLPNEKKVDVQMVSHVSNVKENNNLNIVSELDQDLCLSSQDWLYIDQCSVPKKNTGKISGNLFNSMESQSKGLTLGSPRNLSTFKTPGDESVFRVPLDATIPSFNLSVDLKETSNNAINNALFRPVRDRKVSDLHKSPYIERLTSIHGKFFKKEESDLWNWLHSNNRHLNRILFKWENVTCYKVDFQSMMDGEMIMTSVLDVWCCFLNSLEEFKSPTSPRRLFCYTETTVGTLNAYTEISMQKKYSIFKDNMDHILNTFKINFSEVDLVLFPIHHVNHYYVVCYNIKNPSVEILDNRKSEKKVKELYGQQFFVLHNHFMSYLRYKHYTKVFELERLEPKRLVMIWQTVDNAIDCGIFAMRHMETYFGGGSKSWDSKIAVQSFTQKKQISRLRLLYTYRMLASDLNSMYGLILDEIKDPSILPDEAGSPIK